jgi:hypothetical protein
MSPWIFIYRRWYAIALTTPFKYLRGLLELFEADINVKTVLSIPDKSSFADENDYWIVVNQKLRRGKYDPTLFNSSDEQMFPFIDFAFVPYSGFQKNYLTAKGCMECCIWTTNIDAAEEIFNAIEPVIKTFDSDVGIYIGGQKSSGIQNVYCWMFRVFPLLKS